jgi:nucleotide-binding universal stress UspA family protein
MTPKTILVPTDFSEPSDAALAYAKELADAFDASIHLLTVVEDPLSQPWALESYGPSLADVLEDFKTNARKSLEQALPDADRTKYKAELALAVGSPFHQILNYAKNHPVDLIVMGTHGRGAFAHAILGSVAERVVRFAPCPVLTVRSAKEKSLAA